MPSTFSQLFPPSPSFTEKHLGDLYGKVYVVTGSSSGVGYELADILFGANATVYLAARSASKLDEAKSKLEAAHSSSKGRVTTLSLDLSDLSTIKGSADKFLSRESRLDVLFNNAGVMMPPIGSTTKQGHDLEMGTNCLGPYLFTKLLTPVLIATAASSPPASVRIVWTASMLSSDVETNDVVFDDGPQGGPKVSKNRMNSYMSSKVGDCFLATEEAKVLQQDGVLSLSLHPGIMKTELQRHNSPMPPWLIAKVFKGPRFGAYTELFAGLSPEVTLEHNGRFMVPWGRFGEVPSHIKKALKPKQQGGNGKAKMFLDWCEHETAPFA